MITDQQDFTGLPAISNRGADNQYKYYGKELQGKSLDGVALDWYDYGARFYDPLLLMDLDNQTRTLS